ncbi:MAG: SDR family oxidoreductase [Candidatus Tectomicrobia bacterium]|nr:SDR family oxidoreductase [Candidatus Tectomicrobia bacterium]
MGPKLSGKVAMVTGAAQGIGKAISLALAEEGADLALLDIEGELLEGTAEAVKKLGRRALTSRTDVTDIDQVKKAVELAQKTFGKIDILVNNAGGSGGAPPGVDNLTVEGWHRVINLNLHAPFYCCMAVIPIMKPLGWGRIVNLASGAGRSHSRSRVVPYAAAKAGVMGLTRQLAVELAPFGIHVNAVAPGLTLSDRGRTGWEERGEEEKKDVLLTIAMKRLGEPIDIAKAVVFLASDDASYITGQTLSVDGGHWMF